MLGFEIQLKESGIQLKGIWNLSNDWNPRIQVLLTKNPKSYFFIITGILIDMKAINSVAHHCRQMLQCFNMNKLFIN